MKHNAAVKAVFKNAAGDLAEVKARARRMFDGMGGRDVWLAQHASPTTLRSQWNELATEVRPRASPATRPQTTREANAETARKAKERLEQQLLEELEPYPEPQQIAQ